MRLKLYLTFYRTVLPYCLAIGLIGFLHDPATAIVMFCTFGTAFGIFMFHSFQKPQLYFYYNKSISLNHLSVMTLLLNGLLSVLFLFLLWLF